MTVYRRTPLPERDALSGLIVAESVLAHTRAALQASSGDGVPHEGLVLWLGRTTEDLDTLVLGCAAPVKTSHPQGVHIDERAVGATARSARRFGLGVVAQVHSHPGWDTRHSDGDDDLILMPFDGMFSLVVAHYGRGSVDPAAGAGLHQFQNGRWVKVPPTAMTVVPSLVGPLDEPRTRADA